MKVNVVSFLVTYFNNVIDCRQNWWTNDRSKQCLKKAEGSGRGGPAIIWLCPSGLLCGQRVSGEHPLQNKSKDTQNVRYEPFINPYYHKSTPYRKCRHCKTNNTFSSNLSSYLDQRVQISPLSFNWFNETFWSCDPTQQNEPQIQHIC